MPSPDDEATRDQVVAAAQTYLSETKGWASEEYRLDGYALSEDGSEAVITAVFLADEQDATPGGGSSAELHVDANSFAVLQELGFHRATASTLNAKLSGSVHAPIRVPRRKNPFCGPEHS